MVCEPRSPLDEPHQQVVRTGAPLSQKIMTGGQAVLQLSDHRANRCLLALQTKPPTNWDRAGIHASVATWHANTYTRIRR